MLVLWWSEFRRKIAAYPYDGDVLDVVVETSWLLASIFLRHVGKGN